jgi:hypothetical protein
VRAVRGSGDVKQTGQALATIGALGFLAAVFLMPTSVPSGSFGTGDIINIGLQQRQMLVALGCLALFVAGVIVAVAGVIVEAPGSPTATYALEEEAAVMERWGITRGPSGYQFGSFAYPKLAQAVAQASKTKG